MFRLCEKLPLDIVIIGGGITGGGILRDAALRGMRVALFEKEDYAEGTSSQSSKLIHGGLRYLETFDFRLVFEACRERKRLLQHAPRLVKPLPFLFPVYKGVGRSLPEIAAGVWFYDFLAMFRNIAHPKIMGRKKTVRLQRGLQNKKLRGSVLYFDALTNDTELTLRTIQSGWRHGGLPCNHAEVTDLLFSKKRVVGVRVRDQLNGKTYDVQSRWVVNVAGPWGDGIRKKVRKNLTSKLRPTKGVHLLLPQKRLNVNQAILLLAPSDQRVMFIIPWLNHTIIGTTDTDFHGNPDHVCADEYDVDYLLDAANHYFPLAKLTHNDVISTWAGLRPLLLDQRDNPSAVSREHDIFSDAEGFVSMAGGKLTTFRQMSQELLDWIVARTPEWKERISGCRTHQLPLEEGLPLPPSNDFWSRAEWSMRHEMACTISDILMHRTQKGFLDPEEAEENAHEIGLRLAKLFKFSPEEIARQERECQKRLKKIQSGIRKKPSK